MSSHQFDLFNNGGTDMASSLAPWIDPEKVRQVYCEKWRDADHVDESKDIGRLGSDAMIWLVTAEGHNGETLHARRFTEDQGNAASAYAAELEAKITANRQRQLF